MIRGYREYQSIWDNPLVDGDLLGEQEMGNSQDPQAMAIKRRSMVPQLQVIGDVPKKYLPINLKIWHFLVSCQLCQILAAPKVSLHMVSADCTIGVFCLWHVFGFFPDKAVQIFSYGFYHAVEPQFYRI